MKSKNTRCTAKAAAFLNSPSFAIPLPLQTTHSIFITIYSLVVNLISGALAYILTVVHILNYKYTVLVVMPFIIIGLYGLTFILKRFPKAAKYMGFTILVTMSIYSVESHIFEEPTLMGYAISNMIVMVVNNMLLVDFIPKFYMGVIFHVIHSIYFLARWRFRPDFDLTEYCRFLDYSISFVLIGILLYYYMFNSKYSLLTTFIKEEKTRKSWAQTMECMEIPIIMVDANGKVVYSNGKSEELLSKYNDSPKFLSAIESSIGANSQYTSINNKNYSVKKQKVFFNESDCIMYIFQDITDIVKSEEKKYINLLIATITHELRSPLNIISTILKMIIDTAPEETKTLVSKALVACMLQENLINDILDVSKIENGKLNMNLQPCNVKECSQEIISLFKLQIDSTKLNFTFNCENNFPLELRVDERRFKQIIINLLSNSLKFTTKGHINLSLTYKAPNIYCQVEDTGVGIKEDDYKKIFTRFGMATSNISMNKSGSGIGLNLVKQLCNLMGGDITFSSTFQIGTTFKFYIKAEETEPINVSVNLPTRQNDKSSNLEIVSIDDNQMNLYAMKTFFEKLKLPHIEFQDPTEGLDYILHHVTKIRVAFIDINMPKMSGYDVAYALKHTGIALACLSGEDCEAIEEKCRNCGFKEILEKPISFKKIEALLALY